MATECAVMEGEKRSARSVKVKVFARMGGRSTSARSVEVSAVGGLGG